MMDKTLAGLIGAVGTLAAIGQVQAAPVQPTIDEAMHAGSYADLLKPIPNASALLVQSDARAQAEAETRAASDAPLLMEVQYYRHHHHHHHHRFYRRPYYHHHHHHAYYRRPYYHHHHRSAIVVPGVGVLVR